MMFSNANCYCDFPHRRERTTFFTFGHFHLTFNCCQVVFEKFGRTWQNFSRDLMLKEAVEFVGERFKISDQRDADWIMLWQYNRMHLFCFVTQIRIRASTLWWITKKSFTKWGKKQIERYFLEKISLRRVQKGTFSIRIMFCRWQNGVCELTLHKNKIFLPIGNCHTRRQQNFFEPDQYTDRTIRWHVIVLVVDNRQYNRWTVSALSDHFLANDTHHTDRLGRDDWWLMICPRLEHKHRDNLFELRSWHFVNLTRFVSANLRRCHFLNNHN